MADQMVYCCPGCGAKERGLHIVSRHDGKWEIDCFTTRVTYIVEARR